MKNVIVKMRATKDERDKIRWLANEKSMNVSEYLRYLISKASVAEEVAK